MASTIFTQNIVWNLTLLCNRLTFTQLIRLDSSLFLIIIHLKNLKKKKFHWKMMCLYSLINYVFFCFFSLCVLYTGLVCVCVELPHKEEKVLRERKWGCVCVCVDLVGSFWLSVCVCVRDPPPPLRTPPKGKEGGEREREREGKENAINT